MKPQPSGVSTVRGFWHGPPLGAYQLVCLRSFADRGHRVEVFSYDAGMQVPDWIVRRDANEIWPTDHVLHYQIGFGKGSPALHANLFRYAMLHALGGWWIDLDLVLLRPELPDVDIFFARMAEPETIINSVLKFPAGHPMMAEARDRCVALGETCYWGQSGSDLLKELVSKHGLLSHGQPIETAYPIAWFELAQVFDPARRDDVRRRCEGAFFLHLFNELWRTGAVPADLGPPAGSFLDNLFNEYEVGAGFPARMNYPEVEAQIPRRN